MSKTWNKKLTNYTSPTSGGAPGNDPLYLMFRSNSDTSKNKYKDEMGKIFILRKILAPMGTTEAMEFLLEKMRDTKTNNDFFQSMGTKS